MAKIPSRKFPKRTTKIPSKKFAKTSAPSASGKPAPRPPTRHTRPAQPATEPLKGTTSPPKAPRPDSADISPKERLSELQEQYDTLKSASEIEAPRSKPAGRLRKPQISLFADIPADLPEELFTTLAEAGNVRIERIVSHGHATPWYTQNQNESVIVLKGAARLKFDRDIVELKPGEFLNIPAGVRHRVEWTTPDEPTIWLAIHYG